MGFGTLQSLPVDLFAHMSRLAFLQLETHPNLTQLPAFDGLSNLKYAKLMYLFAVTELPPFTPLKKLDLLELVYLPALTHIPDLVPLRKLEGLAVVGAMQVCCNGFLSNCDLKQQFCEANPSASVPQASCLLDESKIATPATQLVISKNSRSVCTNTALVGTEQPTKESVDACGGKRFRQCELPLPSDPSVLAPGICYNTRMQVLACSLDPAKIQSRKLQISHQVGPPCDPTVESWLGCS